MPNGRAHLALRGLRERFRGQIVLPGDHAYERARAVWNATADARPAAVARCAGVEDVVAAVRVARDHDLLVAVRGGGHSYPGFSTCDDGLVIDLSPMAGVQVDPDRRVATAAGGALLGSWTARPRRTGWPARPGTSPTPASAGSPSAAGSGG